MACKAGFIGGQIIADPSLGFAGSGYTSTRGERYDVTKVSLKAAHSKSRLPTRHATQ